MELTTTQFRTLTKAKKLLLALQGRMTSDEKCLLNEVCSDWADVVMYEPSGNMEREDVKPVWR